MNKFYTVTGNNKSKLCLKGLKYNTYFSSLTVEIDVYEFLRPNGKTISRMLVLCVLLCFFQGV